jgi:hypothetical protein
MIVGGLEADMLREQDFPLPRAVIERAREQGDDQAFGRLMERALRRILEGTPADRKSMMFAALPFTANEDEIFSYPLAIQSDLFRRFEEFCHEKTLNPLVLTVGAMLPELGMATSSSDACVDPHR